MAPGVRQFEQFQHFQSEEELVPEVQQDEDYEEPVPATIDHAKQILADAFPMTVEYWTFQQCENEPTIMATYAKDHVEIVVTFINTDGYGQCFSRSHIEDQILSGCGYASYQNLGNPDHMGRYPFPGLIPQLSAYFAQKGIQIREQA